jgi:hypothetical protein
MGRGTDLARLAGNREHAQLIDDMKDQLLIVLLNRLGGTVDVPVAELDATGGYLASFALKGRPGPTATFHFVVSRKQ